MTFTCPPEFISLAHDLADIARPIALNYFRSATLEAEKKSDHSPVTIADTTIEEKWRGIIRQKRPQDGIWGEEFGHENIDAEYVWLFDPIDGTRAFAAGYPVFGTLIALKHHDHGFVFGLCDAPATEDRWHSALGQGVFMNNKPVKARTTKTIDEAIFACTDPLRLPSHVLSVVQELRPRFRMTNYGGNCLNYALLASGFIDVLIETGQGIHDVAPFVPMIEQAGGVFTQLDGAKITMESGPAFIAAATPELHKEILGLLV